MEIVTEKKPVPNPKKSVSFVVVVAGMFTIIVKIVVLNPVIGLLSMLSFINDSFLSYCFLW